MHELEVRRAVVLAQLQLEVRSVRALGRQLQVMRRLALVDRRVRPRVAFLEHHQDANGVAGARVAFCAQSEEMPPRYVSIQGRVASALPADIARDLKPIVRKYLGAEVGDAYVDNTRPNGTNEIVVRIRPERWFSRDFGRPG